MSNNKFIILPVFVLLTLLTFGLSAQVSAAPAQISVTSSLEKNVKVGDTQVVTWESKNFPKGAFVNINLIKKVSDSPVRYDLVRQIAQYSPNDGQELWVVTKADLGANLYIEVTCAGSTRFKDGCVSNVGATAFAVETNFSNNLANALLSFLQAIGWIE